MRDEASKLFYETPTIGILELHNEGPICQSCSGLIDPGYDNEIEVPITFPQP